MIIVMKENVQRIISDDEFSRFEEKGFKKLCNFSKNAKETSENKKPLSKMNSSELKAFAEELGLEDYDSLTNKELVALIKQTQETGQNE